MNANRFVGFFLMFVCAIVVSLLDARPCLSQKPPPPANPQGPTINPLMPVGIQRGQSVDMTITGTQLASPTGVTFGASSKVNIPADDKNGQDAGKFKLRLDVPVDTPIGWYPFRIATVKGVSNMRVLCIDDLTQETSKGANRSKASAQGLTVPAAVSGSAVADQADYYKINVKAGERISFDCQARRIGSAIDAQMSIYDAKSMRELAFDNDSPGCHSDPRITYTFKEAGEYLIEVKDVLNRGGAEFFYRIRIGDFPLATTAVPMGVKRGTKAKIGFAGPSVEGIVADLDVPNDPSLNVIWVAPKGKSGQTGWPVPVAVSDFEEKAETEPNNSAKEANRITIPGAVTGRFQKGDDLDFYLFSAKKGQKLTIESQSLEFYSPTLVYMIARNAKTNAEVAKSNPGAPLPNDQKIDFTAPEDGDFLLEVQHLHFAGGPSESYRITFRPPANSFDINLANERFDVAPGSAAAIPVQIVRKGYTGPIEVSAQGHPGLSGTVNLKAGQNAGLLLVTAKSDLPMGPYQFRVVGKATVDGQVHLQSGAAKAMVVQSMNGMPYPPLHLPTFVSLAVKEKAPFSLAIKMDPAEGIPGGKAQVTITVTRDAGFEDEITFTPPTGLPPTIPAPKTIAAIGKGKTETTFALDLNPKTPVGEYFILVSAKTKFQGKEYGGAAPPLLLVLGSPFELKVEPATVSLQAGEKAKVKVTAERKGGYKGPIALDFRNLPAGVTAAKTSIAADKSEVEVELVADAKAAPASAANVAVGGTATAMNNLQNVSPAFTVAIQKK